MKPRRASAMSPPPAGEAADVNRVNLSPVARSTSAARSRAHPFSFACRDGLPADRIALVIKEIAVPVRYRVETSSHCASLNLAITFVAPHGRLVRVDIGLPDVNPVNLMAATDD